MLQRGKSLPEVHGSVAVPVAAGFWRKMLAFAGPAFLVSVGYMDPGNWATDIEAGARFGYQLLWVLLLSNGMALLLQSLSARLGIVTGRDLAQACREFYPHPWGALLYLPCQIAIVACDLAEVLGGAVGLSLLTGWPLLASAGVVSVNVFFLFLLQARGMRWLEAGILSLVTVIGLCYVVELWLAKADWAAVLAGYLGPKLTGIRPAHGGTSDLYVAIGMIGATVMPHNLYLHSALVQTRRIDPTAAGKQEAAKFNLVDSAVALNAAFLVNSSILIVAAAVFFQNGVEVKELRQAYETLSPLVGTAMAGTLFAVALLASGQSSTLTGTLAGQIVMEGFLRWRIAPWISRLSTRVLALVPAVLVIFWKGEEGTYDLLILSQVILSLQLPFAVIPLIHFTGRKDLMGEMVTTPFWKGVAWLVAGVLTGLNVWLVYETLRGWLSQ
ncbi:MAG: divalent metal cation transporter [Verrucomicrobia bacterium]|nr:divalent metal cation transporter [Pseudomonadota bacterium]NBS06631.1 divalent metal cation transporter [Verrucomicrobiota bacterium]NBS79221.1 divalent metal cation transporter [bacterium]NBS49975.1 divalent metal cation transporter [Verrucomicrobiota bacterium]NBT24195.1 divalent metal cation transporter [bacterium]